MKIFGHARKLKGAGWCDVAHANNGDLHKLSFLMSNSNFILVKWCKTAHVDVKNFYLFLVSKNNWLSFKEEIKRY